MNYLNQKKFRWRLFIGTILVGSLLIMGNSSRVQAAEKVTLYPDHHYGKYDEGDSSYYYLYPNDKFKDYKKFMKFTYKISDDSVIGLRINGNVDFDYWIYDIDDNGKQRVIPPNDIKVHALGPGTATLKVYNGTKLVDSYVFTVTADSTYSLSSYVNNSNTTGEDGGGKVDELIKKFAMTAADKKYTTTNQRVLAALNDILALGGKVMSEEKFQKLYDADPDNAVYGSVEWRLLKKIATVEAYALTNKVVLSNLGFVCTSGLQNEFEIRDETGTYWVDFKATTKLTSDYDFNIEEPVSVYTRTHLSSWIINADTKQQVIDVGQTVSLSSSDMNSNIFSSDTSIVTAADGKITGVKPGVAIVYRYNDTYCDVFYVLVTKKGAPKTVQAKVYTKSIKSYFSSSDYAPYILGGGEKTCQVDDWNSLRIYDLEPIFGHGGSLKTSYSKGKIKCYVEYNGKSELIYTVGSRKYAD